MSSHDELLAILHDEYLTEVTESGIPRWVYDQYYHGLPKNPYIGNKQFKPQHNEEHQRSG